MDGSQEMIANETPEFERRSTQTADLVGRYLQALQSAKGKTVGANTIFEVLKLEAMDWRMDHGIGTAPEEHATLPEVDGEKAGDALA
jgi:hypothetical protein